MALILVNNTAGDVEVNAIGQTVAGPATTQQDISDVTHGDLVKSGAAAEILALITADQLFINDGSSTLNKADSQAAINNIINGQELVSTDPLVPHANQHENGGSDEINVGGLSGTLSDAQPADASDVRNGPFAIADGGTGSSTRPFVDLVSAETIAGIKTFSSLPESSPAPSTNAQLTNKAYVDQEIAQATGSISWQDPVLDKDLNTPPGGETTGDRYIVAAVATGAWTGQENNIAEYNGSGWDFAIPAEGWVTYVDDENEYYRFNGSAWVIHPHISTHNNLSGIQGGAPADYQHLTTAQVGLLPTSDQKDALTGTDGAPSNANRYVTNSDPRNSDARTPTSHATSHENGGSDEIEIANLGTSETNTNRVLVPDGAGGVQWSPPSSGVANIEVGTTAPSTVDGTILWLNTNTGFNSTLMMRDQARSKWLSTAESTLDFGHDSSDASALRPIGIATPANITAYRMRLDGTIIGIVARAQGGNATKTFQVRLNGTPIGGADFSLAASVYTDNTRNHDFAADDHIVVNTTGAGSAVLDVVVQLIIRWRDS